MKYSSRRSSAILVLALAMGAPLLTLFQNCTFQVNNSSLSSLMQNSVGDGNTPGDGNNDGIDRNFTSSFEDVEFGFTNKINVTHPAHPQNLQSFKRGLDIMQGRAQWVRVYFQDYDVIDYTLPTTSPTDLKFLNDRLARYDQALNEAHNRGFKIMLNFGLISDSNLPMDQFLQRTQALAKFLAERYPFVNAWQIVNEPNIFDFRSWGQLWSVAGLTNLRPETIAQTTRPDSWPAGKAFIRPTYMQELKQAIQISSAEFKKVNPAAKITIAVAWWPKGGDVANYETFIDSARYFINEIRPVVDVVGIDAYLTAPGIPVWIGSGEQPETQENYEQALLLGKDFLKELVSQGEVWINESGYATEGPGRSPDQQYNIIRKSIETFIAAGIKKIILYELQDDFYAFNNDTEQKFMIVENSFGLVDHYGQPKVAYEQVMSFISTKDAVDPNYGLQRPQRWPSGLDSDQIAGSDLPDYLIGMLGDDNLSGFGGDDFIDGGEGNDALSGGTGNDYILAGAGDDKVLGGDNDDFINGNAGNDELSGEKGNDTVRGGQGDDRIRGGLGNDMLFGDKGNDTFLYAITDGKDVIEDIDGVNTLNCVDGLKAKNNPGNNTAQERTLVFNDGGQVTIKAGSSVDFSSCLQQAIGSVGSACEVYNWSGQVRGQGTVQSGSCQNAVCQAGMTLHFSTADQKYLCVASSCSATVNRDIQNPQVVSSVQSSRASCWQYCLQATGNLWTENERKTYNTCWFERGYIYSP